VWHVSVSVWSRRNQPVNNPRAAEREAIRLLKGVGGSREWWIWNPEARIGHLRVGLTVLEAANLAPGLAVHDAGDSGPERKRRR
jgi:hypothetical protein